VLTASCAVDDLDRPGAAGIVKRIGQDSDFAFDLELRDGAAILHSKMQVHAPHRIAERVRASHERSYGP
jgi:hypothetical protein